MHSSKTPFSTLFVAILSISFLFSGKAQALQQNDDFMTLTILGAVGSLGLACSQGKAPCAFEPGVNLEKLSISLDQGSDLSAKHISLSVGANWIEPVYTAESWEVVGRLEGRLHHWWSTLDEPLNKSGLMLGITPVFQYQPKDYTFGNSSIFPFVEMGGGPYLMDDIIFENENKRTQFQFGSILGLGIKGKQFEATFRYLHISNAGIEMPNPGVDFHSLHIGYYF